MNYEDFNDFDNDYNNMFDLKEEDENYFMKQNNFSAIKEIPEEENKMDVEESNKKNNNNINNKKNNNNKNINNNNINNNNKNNNNDNNNEELNYDLLKNKKKYKKNSFDFSEENSQSNSEIENEKKNKKKNKKNSENNEIINFDFPDVNKLDELSLKEECRKYGIKNNNIKNMKQSLQEIYNFLKNKILPQNLQNDLNNFLNQENNQNQNNLKNDKNFLSDEKKNLIVNIIKNNKEIWGKILLFQSLELKEVKKVLNENKITISNNQLKELLNNFGVVLNVWKK